MEDSDHDKSILHGGFTMKRTMRKRIEKLKVANFEGAHKFNTERTAAVEKQKAQIAAEAALKKGKKTGWFGIRKSEDSLRTMREKINAQTEKKLSKANKAAKRAIYHQLKLRAKLVNKKLLGELKEKLPALNIATRSKKLKGAELNEKLQRLRAYVGKAESVVSAQRADEAAAAAKAIEEPRKKLMEGIQTARDAQDSYRLATVQAEQAKQKINRMSKGNYFENEYFKKGKTFEEYQSDLQIAQRELQDAEKQKRTDKEKYETEKKKLPLLKQYRKDMYAAEKRFRATTIEGLQSKLAGVKRNTPRGPILSRKLAEKTRKAAKATATKSTKNANNIAATRGELETARTKVQYNTNYTKKRVLTGNITTRKEDTVEAIIRGKNIDEQTAIKNRFDQYVQTKEQQSEKIDNQINEIRTKLNGLNTKNPNKNPLEEAIKQLSNRKLGLDMQQLDAANVSRDIQNLINKQEKLIEIDNFIRSAGTKQELEQKRDEINQEQENLRNQISQNQQYISNNMNNTMRINNQSVANKKLMIDYLSYEYMKKYNKTVLESSDLDYISKIYKFKFGTYKPGTNIAEEMPKITIYKYDVLNNFYMKNPETMQYIVDNIKEITRRTSEQAELLVNENVNKQIIETLNKKIMNYHNNHHNLSK